jgi:hypothetical protein
MSFGFGFGFPKPARAAGGVAFPLDGITTPTYAFSTRQLSASSPATCMTVRRSSDNTTTTVAYSGGWLNEATITSHVGVSNGFITDWNNQGSVGGVATQAFAGFQPRIALSGTIDKIGTATRPAPFNDGSRALAMASQALANIATSGTDITVAMVWRRQTSNANGGAFGWGDSASNRMCVTDPDTGLGSVFWDCGNDSTARFTTTWASDGGGTVPITLQRTFRRSGTTMEIRRNAGAASNSGTRSGNLSGGPLSLYIMSDQIFNGPINTGYLAEIVIWNTGSVTGLAAFEANQMTAFGV